MMSPGAIRAELAHVRGEARRVRAELLRTSRALRESRGPHVRAALRADSERRHRERKLRTTVADLERLELPAQVALLREKLGRAEAENLALRTMVEESQARERSALVLLEALTAELAQLQAKHGDLELELARQKDPARSARCRVQAARRREKTGEWESAFLLNLEQTDGSMLISSAFALRECRRLRWASQLSPEQAAVRLAESAEEDPDHYWQFEDARIAELETRWSAEQAELETRGDN